jgi:uncharacterized protein (TIGR03084 family)
MSDLLDQVLGDLALEGAALDALVSPLDDAGWRTPTPATGWDIAAQVAHLAWTDEVAVFAATDKAAWDEVVLQAIADPEGFAGTAALAGAQASPAEILARWREARPALHETLRDYPEGERIPWFGPPMSPTSMATARFMETWAHSLDVAEALDVAPQPTDRIRHVAHLGVRTRNYSYGVQGLEPPTEAFRVELRSPSGELWEWGPPEAEQSVRGSAYDFCLRVTQRRHRDDLELVATGPDADKWLDIAQAFAGPPGQGRSPASDG